MAEALAGDGREVVATYRNRVPAIFNDSRIKTLRLDLTDSRLRLDDVDVVVHAAAVHPHTQPPPTAQDYVHSNLLATLNVIDFCRTHHTRFLIFLSSVSVHGTVGTSELDETTPISNPGLYGISKYFGEKALSDSRDQVSSVAIRLPGVVGRGAFTPWLGTVLERALCGESIPIYNAEAMFNNLIDVSELGRFVNVVIGSSFSGCEVVNIAASEPIRVREAVELIVSETASKSGIHEQVAARPSFSIRTDRIRHLFGFEPASTREVICRFVKDNLGIAKQLPVS